MNRKNKDVPEGGKKQRRARESKMRQMTEIQLCMSEKFCNFVREIKPAKRAIDAAGLRKN